MQKLRLQRTIKAQTHDAEFKHSKTKAITLATKAITHDAKVIKAKTHKAYNTK